MTIRDRIRSDYFEWMMDTVCGKKHTGKYSYRKLLQCLHDIYFTQPYRHRVKDDSNRVEDGICLRRRFALIKDCEEIIDYLDGPCTVLEMMVALAIRMEKTIMDDPAVGDRTSQWFRNMLVSLKLGDMFDERFDETRAVENIERFLRREYEPNGAGGLFTLKHCSADLRKVEIWRQMCWYLDEFLGYKTGKEE